MLPGRGRMRRRERKLLRVRAGLERASWRSIFEWFIRLLLFLLEGREGEKGGGEKEEKNFGSDWISGSRQFVVQI